MKSGRSVLLEDTVERFVFHVARAMVELDYVLLGPDAPYNGQTVAEEVAEAVLEEHRQSPDIFFDAPDPNSMEDLEAARERQAHDRWAGARL